jgi:hypothetical protein
MGLLRQSRFALVPVALCLVMAVPAAAQTTSASLAGAVADAQGGMLPGATVTLTSNTQGTSQSATADAQGRFVFPIIRPDTYSLKVVLQGFKTLERKNLVVNANDRIALPPVTLEVGAMTEEVLVVERMAQLQSADGARSFALESETLKNIAANGRSMFNFATLVPGVASQNTGGMANEAVSSFTVNGQRPNSNNMTIDGVANIDTGDNGGNMATTNIDAVSEFKILTNAYQAEYGRAVGGQVQVVTKSGTQQFHGSGYWYGRNSDWNANSWTNLRNGADSPVGVGKVTEKAESSRNDRGFTIGGPVFIPGTFNTDKTKLFFFWSEEWQSRKDPVSNRDTRVPTELERRGDFSQSVDSNGNPFPYIRDHTTGLPCSASDTRGCFQDGGVIGRIPANRIWAPGQSMLNIFPAPNYSAGLGVNYTSQNPSDRPRREDLIRLDFQPTDKWRFTGRYMNTKDDEVQAYGTTWAGSGSDQLPMPVLHPLPGRNWMVSATGILNSTTSLELNVGGGRNALTYELQAENLYRANAGLTGLPYLYPEAVQGDYIPWLEFRGGRTGNAGQYQTNQGPFVNENKTFDAIANLTKIFGAHSAKFGVYFQQSYKAQSNFASFNGRINFTDSSSNPYDTGFSYANAITGVFNTYQQANAFLYPEYVYKNLEFYGQDNWKVNSKLTVDYGVRFYYMTPQYDQTLQTSTFIPGDWSAADAPRLYYPVCIGASPCSGSNLRGMDPALIGTAPPSAANTVEGRFVGRLVSNTGDRFNGAYQAGQGINDTMYGGNVFKVSPRLGVVYDLSGNGDTILRGGFGIFYDRPQGNIVFDTVNNAPGLLQPTVQWGTMQTLVGGTSDPYPALGMQPTAYDFVPPKVYAWNTGVQHRLFKNIVLDIAYVGSSSKNLIEQEQINALPLGTLFKAENQDPTRTPSSTPGATAYTTDLLRPYRGYGGIRWWAAKGYSNYHALQTSVTRRFENGLMFSVFYVWSKTLGVGNTDWSARIPYSTDEENKRVNYSYTDYDRPHNFVINAIYQTPKVAGGVLGALANNWQLSGVYRWNSGRPYAINWSVPGIGSNNLTGGTDVTSRVVVTCDPGKGSSGDPYRQIDTSCFAPPQVGSKGDESARFFLHAPPINNLDLSISKTFPIAKTVRLEIRADAFNALNHTQFTGVNSTVSFASLTDKTVTNLPFDASGNLIRTNGFGTINGVAPPRIIQLMTRLTF